MATICHLKVRLDANPLFSSTPPDYAAGHTEFLDLYIIISIDEFKDLLQHGSEVSTLTAQDFDPRGQYKNVLQAVEKAGDGVARVFRVHHGSTRAEYYVVGLDKKGKKVVGLKAKAVES